MKDRIKNLLAGGMKAVDVASTVGCTPAYISQLWANEEFRKEVEALATANAQEKTEDEHLDTRYVNLEHKLLTNIEKEADNAEFPQLVRALETIAKRSEARARAKVPAIAANNNTTNIHITQIALPAHAMQLPAPVVQTNELNEIVAIDNRPLAPMSSTGVKNIFAQMKERIAQKALEARQQSNIVAEI